MNKRSEKRSGKRELIVNAAAKLFFNRGYMGTTMNAICEELGRTKPFVYFYFKDKSEILEAIAFDAAEVTMSSLKRGAEGKEGAAARLQGALREFFQSHTERFESGSLYLRESAYFSKAAQRRMRKLSRGFRDDLLELLEDALKEGVIPPQNISITASAIGGIAGFMFTWYRPHGELAPAAVAEELVLRALCTAQANVIHGVTPAASPVPKSTPRRAPRAQSASAPSGG